MSAFFFRWLKEKSNLEAVTFFDYGVQKRHTRWAETREECSSFREQKDLLEYLWDTKHRVYLGYPAYILEKVQD